MDVLVRRTKKKDEVCALVIRNTTISSVWIFADVESNDEPLVFWSGSEQFQCVHEAFVTNDIR